MGVLKIGVIGAGIVGVNTGLELQKDFRTADITMIADRFDQDTTSDGAAGIWYPSVGFTGPDYSTTKDWLRVSYEHYNDLLPHGCGIMKLTGFHFSNMNPDAVRVPIVEDIVPVYRAASEDELKGEGVEWKYGTYFHTLLIEGRHFLPWALNKFVTDGGRVSSETVGSFADLTGQFDVVVNCTGLGAKRLCNDSRMVPIRGQILKVSAPWLEHFYFGDRNTYIIPASGGQATLGGTRNYDSYGTEACRHDTASIRERCSGILPRLAEAPLLRTWVGLRPHRDVVRVEPQFVSGLKVVHNYGHGGYGVTSSPGTAKHSVRLVKDVLSARNKL